MIYCVLFILFVIILDSQCHTHLILVLLTERIKLWCFEFIYPLFSFRIPSLKSIPFSVIYLECVDLLTGVVLRTGAVPWDSAARAGRLPD